MTSRSAPEPTDSGELPLDSQSGVTDTAGEAMTTCSVPEPTDAGEQPLDRQHEVTETDEERETRLALCRARYRARRAARSLPARETRLQHMRFAARHRGAAESSEDREGGLVAAFINIVVYYSCSIINNLSSQYKFIQFVMHCMTLC